MINQMDNNKSMSDTLYDVHQLFHSSRSQIQSDQRVVIAGTPLFSEGTCAVHIILALFYITYMGLEAYWAPPDGKGGTHELLLIPS